MGLLDIAVPHNTVTVVPTVSRHVLEMKNTVQHYMMAATLCMGVARLLVVTPK